MTAGLLLSENKRYLWASETTYGVDAVQAILQDATKDIIYQQVRNLDIVPEGAVVHVPRVRGSSGGNRSGFIQGKCNVSGEIPLTPFIGAASPVPYSAPILKAMNLKETIVGETSTYTPSTAQQASVTIYEFTRAAETNKWRLMVVTGVRLSGNLTFSPRSEPIINIEGGGHYYRLSDAAAFFDSDGKIVLQKDGTTAVPARDGGSEFIADQDPLMCQGLGVQAESANLTVSEMTLTLNTTVTEIESISGDSTISKFVVTRSNQDSRIGVGFNLSDYTEAVMDFFLDEYETAGEFELTAALDSGSGKVSLAMGKVQIGIPAGSANNNVMQFEIPGFLNEDVSTGLLGDNDFELKFEASPT